MDDLKHPRRVCALSHPYVQHKAMTATEGLCDSEERGQRSGENFLAVHKWFPRLVLEPLIVVGARFSLPVDNLPQNVQAHRCGHAECCRYSVPTAIWEAGHGPVCDEEGKTDRDASKRELHHHLTEGYVLRVAAKGSTDGARLRRVPQVSPIVDVVGHVF